MYGDIMSTNHQKSQNARAQPTKVVHGPITGKDIFYTFFPEGFKVNPLYEDGDDPNNRQLQFYVQCGVQTCKRQTLSPTASNYTNAVNHIRTHYNEDEIKTIVGESRIAAAAVTNKGGQGKKQSDLINLNIIQLIYLFYAPRLIQISILIHFPDQRINSIAWQIEN